MENIELDDDLIRYTNSENQLACLSKAEKHLQANKVYNLNGIIPESTE